MDECVNFDTFVIHDFCSMIDRKGKIWSDFIEHTEPKLTCPSSSKFVKVTNATFDMGYIERLPLDGHIWIFYIKLFKPIPNVRHKKESLFCMMFESKITKSPPGEKKAKLTKKT